MADTYRPMRVFNPDTAVWEKVGDDRLGAVKTTADTLAAAHQTGHGSPEGLVTAPAGTLYTDLDGTGGVWLHVKTTEGGATGWSARTSPVPIDPLNLPHLEAAYSSRWPLGIGVDLPADGDPVSQWSDLSGHGRHLAQSTSASQPLWQAATDGHPAGLAFDGADDSMRTDAVEGTSEVTIYAVAQQLAPAGTFAAIVSHRDSSDHGYTLYAETNAHLRVATIPYALNDGASTLDCALYTVVGGAAGGRFYVNGALAGSSSSPFTPASSGSVGVGNRIDGSRSYYLNGIVTDLLVLSAAHDDATRRGIEAWLAARNNITLGA